MWDGTFQLKTDKDRNADMRFFTGPIAVLYKGGVMARIDVKIPVSESTDLKYFFEVATMVFGGIAFRSCGLKKCL